MQAKPLLNVPRNYKSQSSNCNSMPAGCLHKCLRKDLASVS